MTIVDAHERAVDGHKSAVDGQKEQSVEEYDILDETNSL